MKTRIDTTKIPPGVFKAMFGLGKYVDECGLEPDLLNLIKLRASQLNGCAYCIDMHSKDLRAAGESEQRIYELDAWRETPFYSEREQAALAWTRSSDHFERRARAGRGLRSGPQPVQREGVDRFDHGDCCDQWLEPPQCCIPNHAGKLYAGAIQENADSDGCLILPE